MSDLPQILVLGHLGLGDGLILNGILRHLAQSHNVFALCKRHNATTLNFMTRDIRNIEWLIVEGDGDALEFCDQIARKGFKVLKLGLFSPPFEIKKWDSEFYRKAGIPFEDRWDNFKVSRQPQREIKPPDGEFCFVHENASQGSVIDRKRLPDMPLVFADPGLTQNLFDWWGHLEKATELHLMESCFAVLADSLPYLQARRVVIHAYARKSIPPTYRRAFEILRS